MAAPPVVPSASCWLRTEQRLDEISGRRPSALRSRSARWLALAAGLAAIALLVGRMTIWAPPSWEPVAALAPANAAPLWQIERDAAGSRLNLRVVGTIELAASKSYELWVLPVGAGNPVSLGLLPRGGNLERHLDDRQRRLLLAGAQVAVSIEPVGGSPTGVPTGPVVIVAPIVKHS
jgi:anti-sigma-K factor RskA